MGKLEQDHQRVLLALENAYCDDREFPYLHNRHISTRSGVPIQDVRKAVRALRAGGLVQYMGGLVTEEFAFYGSGHAITEAGRRALDEGGER